MIASDFTRDRCRVGRRTVSYDRLVREYRCAETTDGQFCKGRPVIVYEDGAWTARCGVCGAQNFLHESDIARQRNKVVELLDHMPADTVQAYLKNRRKPCQS